jgi:hypothetical protein
VQGPDRLRPDQARLRLLKVRKSRDTVLVVSSFAFCFVSGRNTPPVLFVAGLCEEKLVISVRFNNKDNDLSI